MKRKLKLEKGGSSARNIVISVVILLAVITCFWHTFNAFSARTVAEEKALLESALDRDIIHCYAIEGTYPESLAYIKKNYGLNYDESRFYIDYQPLGENLYPEVTVIEVGGDSR